MSSNRTKRQGIHLNVIYIIELLLFTVMNKYVFKYNLCEDISNYVSVYLSNCGSTVETASDSVCYGSTFRLYIIYYYIYCNMLYSTIPTDMWHTWPLIWNSKGNSRKIIRICMEFFIPFFQDDKLKCNSFARANNWTNRNWLESSAPTRLYSVKWLFTYSVTLAFLYILQNRAK